VPSLSTRDNSSTRTNFSQTSLMIQSSFSRGWLCRMLYILDLSTCSFWTRAINFVQYCTASHCTVLWNYSSFMLSTVRTVHVPLTFVTCDIDAFLTPGLLRISGFLHCRAWIPYCTRTAQYAHCTYLVIVLYVVPRRLTQHAVPYSEAVRYSTHWIWISCTCTVLRTAVRLTFTPRVIIF